MLSIIPERDVCLFHEDGDGQSPYPCPSPLVDRGGDDLEDLMALPCQVWFDTEAPRSPRPSSFFENVSPIRGPNRVTKRELSQLRIPQHKCWHSESRRRVRREKRDEATRRCWTADRRRSGSATERSWRASSECGVSRKDHETVEKQAKFQ